MSPTPDPAQAGAAAPSSPAGELGSILLLTAVWVCMAMLVDPRGEFWLNDDWSHALPVKALVEQGSIRFTF